MFQYVEQQPKEYDYKDIAFVGYLVYRHNVKPHWTFSITNIATSLSMNYRTARQLIQKYAKEKLLIPVQWKHCVVYTFNVEQFNNVFGKDE